MSTTEYNELKRNLLGPTKLSTNGSVLHIVVHCCPGNELGRKVLLKYVNLDVPLDYALRGSQQTKADIPSEKTVYWDRVPLAKKPEYGEISPQDG